jgi:hypothetical protein
MEFLAACEGHLEKQRESEKLVRFASYRIAECVVGTKAVKSIENFWPMGDEEAPKKIDMSKERYEAILKRHKIKAK